MYKSSPELLMIDATYKLTELQTPWLLMAMTIQIVAI